MHLLGGNALGFVWGTKKTRSLTRKLFGTPYRLHSFKFTSSTLTNFSPANPPNGAEAFACNLSQPPKSSGEARVVRWLEEQRSQAYTSAIVIAQLAHWIQTKEGKTKA